MSAKRCNVGWSWQVASISAFCQEAERVDDRVADAEPTDVVAQQLDEVRMGGACAEAAFAGTRQRHVDAYEAVLRDVKRHVGAVTGSHRQARRKEQERP